MRNTSSFFMGYITSLPTTENPSPSLSSHMARKTPLPSSQSTMILIFLQALALMFNIPANSNKPLPSSPTPSLHSTKTPTISFSLVTQLVVILLYPFFLIYYTHTLPPPYLGWNSLPHF